MDLSFANNIPPTTGCLLLSDPFEKDVHFVRSVVLVCNHDKEGTFGFVLNHYLDLPPESLHDDLQHYHEKLSIGGPVDKSNLFYIHRSNGEIQDSVKIIDNLYFGGDFQEIVNQLESGNSDFKVRFFIGYSGWDTGQLEDELTQNAWIVVNQYDLDQLFDTKQNNLWKDLLRAQGPKFQVISDFTITPENN